MKHKSFCFGGQLLGQHMSILGGAGQDIGGGHSSPPCCCIGRFVIGHLKLTTMGLGQHLWSGPGQAGWHIGGGGQHGDGGHFGLQGLTMTQQGGNGLQHGTGQSLLPGIFLGGGQQLLRMGRTIIAGEGQTGPQHEDFWHGSRQLSGGQQASGGQHFGGQIGGLTTKAIFLQQGGGQHGGGMKHLRLGRIQGSGRHGGGQQTLGNIGIAGHRGGHGFIGAQQGPLASG